MMGAVGVGFVQFHGGGKKRGPAPCQAAPVKPERADSTRQGWRGSIVTNIGVV
jgi:hypothetical protein